MSARSVPRSTAVLSLSILLLASTMATPGGFAAPKARAVSPDYVQALGAASQFLGAWVWRDQDRGLASVSARLRKMVPAGDLKMYFSGVSNPHHEAFEVLPGRRVSPNRYSFRVRLYTYYTADHKLQPTPPMQEIVVVRERRLRSEPGGVWVVDNLPGR